MEVLSYASCREVSPPLEKAEWLFFEEKQTGLAILLPAIKSATQELMEIDQVTCICCLVLDGIWIE